MKYMGSKARLAKEILPIILKNRKSGQLYIEPFAGGMNLIDKVENPRIANDANEHLIDMFKALCFGWTAPEYIEKDFYIWLKNNKPRFPLTGWAGFNCSYSGKYFGGFAGITQTKNGVRNYQQEARKNILSQIEKLKGVVFMNLNYWEIQIPNNSIIYCDPPYSETTEYDNKNFDHNRFWQWVREISKNSEVFISEYKAPEDFKCVWSKQISSSLSANGKFGSNKKSIEKLFTVEK